MTYLRCMGACIWMHRCMHIAPCTCGKVGASNWLLKEIAEMYTPCIGRCKRCRMQPCVLL